MGAEAAAGENTLGQGHELNGQNKMNTMTGDGKKGKKCPEIAPPAGNIVPTGLVITSNESASSIETQFISMCGELDTKIQSINLILDEKKCGTMKYAIEHI